MMARLWMVQTALLVSKGSVLVRSQQVFHLLDGQDWNKIFDVCSLLKLARCGAQSLFDFGYRTRERFSESLHDTLPLRLLALKGGSLFQLICNWYIHRQTPCLDEQIRPFTASISRPERSLTDDSTKRQLQT
jgi:hypothetical protein